MEFYDTDTEDTLDLTTPAPRKETTIAGSRSPPAHSSDDPNSMNIDDIGAATNIELLVDANRINTPNHSAPSDRLAYSTESEWNSGPWSTVSY